MRIEAVWAGSDERLVSVVRAVPAGSRFGDVLETLRAALIERGADCAGLDAGVFGKRRDVDEPLRDGDRVEFYRPLLADPKTTRRQRVEAARARQARSKWRPAR
ncbi:MAG: RnfH family protein [Burkholderiales bacterium]|nr:MAG: RnfH family protein [Burkholderiales bacterium]